MERSAVTYKAGLFGHSTIPQQGHDLVYAAIPLFWPTVLRRWHETSTVRTF